MTRGWLNCHAIWAPDNESQNATFYVIIIYLISLYFEIQETHEDVYKDATQSYVHHPLPRFNYSYFVKREKMNK
jgi:hypothetical protein